MTAEAALSRMREILSVLPVALVRGHSQMMSASALEGGPKRADESDRGFVSLIVTRRGGVEKQIL